MKSTTTYECEICGNQSKDAAEIMACEAIPMKPTEIKPGDKVIIGRIGGSGYGWWRGSMEWFLEDDARKDKVLGDHFRARTIGHPIYAVLDVVPYGQVSSGSVGAWGHRYAAILYSPDHANRGDRRIAFMWHGCEGLTKVGECSDMVLNHFRDEAAKLGQPEYGSY